MTSATKTNDRINQTADADLLKLAAEPVQPLFGVLQQASAMTPLVVLLAMLPALFAVANRTPTDSGAVWGLKAMAMASADNLNEFVDPGSSNPTIALKWQPPLMSWFTALSLITLGKWTDAAIAVPAYLFTVGLVGISYVLVRNLGDARWGLLTALFLGLHADVLMMSQEPSPHAASLFFAVLTIYGFVYHLQNSVSRTSLYLLLGGIGLGFCLLCDGLLAVVVFVTLLFYVLGVQLFDFLQRETVTAPTPRSATGFRLFSNTQLDSLLILAGTAFAVGGWWELMMGARYGTPFWSDWLSGYSRWGPARADAGVRETAGAASSIWYYGISESAVVLLGLAAFGLWQAVRRVRRCRGQQRCWFLYLLIVWSIVALSMLQVSRWWTLGLSINQSVWRGYLLIPLLVLASFGTLQIIQRRAGLKAVAGIALLTAANLTWRQAHENWHFGLFLRALLFILLLLLVYLLVRSRSWRFFQHDSGRRFVTSALLVAIAGGHCIWSFQKIRSLPHVDPELASIRENLSAIEDVTHFTIITPYDLPPKLEFLLKSLWLNASGSVVDSWESALKNISRQLTAPSGNGPTQENVQIFFVWQTSHAQFPAIVGETGKITPLPPVEYFAHHQLATYVMRQSSF